MKHAFTAFICAFVSVCAASTQARAESADYRQATSYYTQRKYDLAAKAYAEAVRKEPANASAYLAEANCLYMLNKRAEASIWYKTVLQRFPSSPQSVTAAKYLQALEPKTATSETPVSEKPQQNSENAAATSTKSASTPTAPLYKVLRPLGQHPYCDPEFVAQIKNSLRNCPKRVVNYIAAQGGHITITPTFVDRYPELGNSRPRGYDDGLTGKNVPACFDQGEVVVAEYSLIGENGQQWEKNEDAVSSVRHEFGHAIDYYMGMLSDKEEFRHIYYLDRGRMEPEDKQTLSYYVQEGKSLEIGPSETFAEACCTIFGGREADWSKKRSQAFARCFPQVIKYVQSKLNSIQ